MNIDIGVNTEIKDIKTEKAPLRAISLMQSKLPHSGYSLNTLGITVFFIINISHCKPRICLTSSTFYLLFCNICLNTDHFASKTEINIYTSIILSLTYILKIITQSIFMLLTSNLTYVRNCSLVTEVAD